MSKLLDSEGHARTGCKTRGRLGDRATMPRIIGSAPASGGGVAFVTTVEPSGTKKKNFPSASDTVVCGDAFA
ncbi:MAG: hypothetical protein KIT84_22375 [Labilithrix sp.]|nr:hypothetical protein [Labilithrix sp.]MCW5813792.1 hypothetical protein [Labilithrix sp.]